MSSKPLLNPDIESQRGSYSGETTTSPASEYEHEDAGLEDNSKVPRLPLLKLFWYFFYNFGLFAWGGSVAQISLLKDELVMKEKWITVARFQRIFSVYQILPGPEAVEICMFFGCLSAGRVGGIVAGIAFCLPGFILMLLASYLYALAGLENKYFNASFRAVQPIVADHSVIRHSSRKADPYLIIAALCTALNGALRINIFISLGLYGVIYALIRRRYWILGILLFVLQYATYAVYVAFRGVPSPVSLALGIAKTPSLINLFLLGLVAGTISFGGAYTAIPFIQVEAVLKGAWLTQRVFVDCIAIGNVLPAPVVMFATFVGFQGGLVDGGFGNGFAGAVVISLGIFFPCFVFTVAGHHLLEKLVRNKLLSDFFDGLCAAVVGVIAIIAVQILKSSVQGSPREGGEKSFNETIERLSQSGSAAVLYVVALATLYKFNHRYTPVLLLASGAIAGQFLFID